MPFKDREAKLAYQRKWYAEHRELVVARVAKRKRTLYAGVCVNCGDPTVGNSKNDIPEYCGKPACKSAQHKANPDVFSRASKRGHALKTGGVTEHTIWNADEQRWEDA